MIAGNRVTAHGAAFTRAYKIALDRVSVAIIVMVLCANRIPGRPGDAAACRLTRQVGGYMSQALVTGLNGLSYAFILFLLAAGFSLTFGVMGVLNLTHGALFVFGAYVGLQVIDSLGTFWLAIILAAAALAVIGFLLYFFFLKHLYNKVPEQAVLTIGLSYMVANVILWIWGPRAQIAQTPEILVRGAQGRGAELSDLPHLHCGVGLLVLALLWWIQDRTRWGAIIRAGMDNKEMTVSSGRQLRLREHPGVPAGRSARRRRGHAGRAHRRAPIPPWATTCCC